MGAGCGRLKTVAAVEGRFVVNSVPSANHRLCLAFAIQAKVLELASTALRHRFFGLCANYRRRSVRHCRILCAHASVSGRRSSTSGGYSGFPIACPHPVLRMHRRYRTEHEIEHYG